jgi:tetratricopeptide (TPR) repeat protein
MREIDLQTAVHEIVVATQRKTRENKADYPFFLIVGAGISHPPIPLAAGIEKLCREEIAAQGLKLPPEPMTAFERYQTYFELAFPHAKDRQDFLHNLLRNAPISAANFRLAHLLGEGPLTNLVFTPNFDEMLTRALRLLGYEAVICDHPKTAQRIEPRLDRIQVVHVHGTSWYYDCCNLSEEISAVAAEGESMRGLHDQVLRDRSPIIVGYSGWEEDVIMSALRRRLQQRPLPRSVYWFCFKRSEADTLPHWLKDHPSVRLVLPPAPVVKVTQDFSRAQMAVTLLTPERFEEGAGGSESTLSAQRVFEAFNQRFELKAPRLTNDPIGFFYMNLRANLQGDGDILGADLYSIGEVLRRVEKGAELERDWRQRGSKVQRENLAALERMRNAMRTAAYREVVEAARGIKLEALDVSECEELELILEQIYLAVHDSDPEIGLDACGIRSGISEEILTVDQANFHSAWALKVAKALHGQGYCLNRLNCHERALASFSEVVRRFGEAPTLPLRERVAKALIGKGATLAQTGDPQAAIESFDEVVVRFDEAPEAALREQVAKALVNKGLALRQAGDSKAAIASYDEVVGRFGDAPEPALRELVAKALVNKGWALGQAGDPKAAIASYDEVVLRFGDAPEPALREQVAKALLNKGVVLGKLGNPKEEIEIYDEVVRRFGDAPEPALRELVALAISNKMVNEENRAEHQKTDS